jgi:dihydroorotase-like cyclic amidohydrolase
MGHQEVIRNENTVYKCGWTPAEGLATRGRPVMTILRGTVIVDDGTVLVPKGFGQFVRA